jgi:hypothetical protein
MKTAAEQRAVKYNTDVHVVNKKHFVSSERSQAIFGPKNWSVDRELDLQTADNGGFIAIVVLEAKNAVP